MTSYFVPGLIVGYVLGVASMCGLVGLYLLHRPRYVAPTMHNRKWRDDPVPEPVQAEQEDGVRYQFMGATGLED